MNMCYEYGKTSLVVEVGIVAVSRIVKDGWTDLVSAAHRDCWKWNLPIRGNRIV